MGRGIVMSSHTSKLLQCKMEKTLIIAISAFFFLFYYLNISRAMGFRELTES